MERATIDILRKLNNGFYLSQHESFSQSRQAAWPGWERLIARLPKTGRLDVLDIACGNMRFEKHLAGSLPAVELQALCVDACDDLAEPLAGCEYRHDDVVESLLSEDATASNRWGSGHDAVVSFGFMHHVPSRALRARFLDTLVDAAKPDGIVAVSLWRFADDGKMREKARRTTAEALAILADEGAAKIADELEPGDYLVGWNDAPGVYRYCHSFDDDEANELVCSVLSRTVVEDRYRADGRTGRSNDYIVLRCR